MLSIRIAAITLLVVLCFASPAPRVAAQNDERCFVETNQCISGPIRTYWEQNGGLAVFGLPLGPQQAYNAEDGRTLQAQWFERHRLEIHPENPAPYNVLLGRLGVDRLVQQGRNWQDFPRPDPADVGDAERCRLFQETGFVVCDEFLQAFRSFGLSFPGRPGITYEESLALFGLPISPPLTETIEGREFTVQWFERARFELHPENQPPFNVLFGRLGAELSVPGGQPGGQALRANGWQLESFGPIDAPEAAAITARPATLAFDGAQVSGFSGCNGFGGTYQATDSTIAFGNIVATLIACVDEVIDRQERAIFAALDGETSYSIADGRLRISYDEGRQALTYRVAPAAAVRGTVTYRERIALPPQAVIEVQLVDVSLADAPATVISSVSINAEGRQVPFAFELPYDPAQIDPRFSYAVQARITVDGQLRFISTTRNAVITQGNPTELDVVVSPV
jgi:uncharacterized lipoprotein YbaY/heat shock protein HslJ